MLATFCVLQAADQENMIKRLEMKLDVNRERLDKVRSTFKTVKAV